MDQNIIPPDSGHDWTWLWSSISGAIGALFAWLFGYRKESKELQAKQAEIDTLKAKTKAEVDSNEIDNVEKAIAIWRNIAQDMEARFNVQMKAFTEEVSKLQGENQKLHYEVNKLQGENKELRKQVEKLTRENAELKTQIEMLNS